MALVIREHKGKVFYEAKWRDASGRQVKRRVGAAWLERDATGQWRPRRGRGADGCLDEKSAGVVMNRLITEHASLGARPAAPAAVTFDELAGVWLHHVEHVDGIKPFTLKSYRCVALHGTGKPRWVVRPLALAGESSSWSSTRDEPDHLASDEVDRVPRGACIV